MYICTKRLLKQLKRFVIVVSVVPMLRYCPVSRSSLIENQFARSARLVTQLVFFSLRILLYYRGLECFVARYYLLSLLSVPICLHARVQIYLAALFLYYFSYLFIAYLFFFLMLNESIFICLYNMVHRSLLYITEPTVRVSWLYDKLYVITLWLYCFYFLFFYKCITQ